MLDTYKEPLVLWLSYDGVWGHQRCELYVRWDDPCCLLLICHVQVFKQRYVQRVWVLHPQTPEYFAPPFERPHPQAQRQASLVDVCIPLVYMCQLMWMGIEYGGPRVPPYYYPPPQTIWILLCGMPWLIRCSLALS